VDRLTVAGPASDGVPSDGTNLVLRAVAGARRLARARGRDAPGLEIALEKHIPAQAGLGGGSSDAAAAVYGAASLFGFDPDHVDVLEALAELGSDCPFFLRARASGVARCTGRGERVEPWPGLALPWTLALFTPGFGCATGEVYRALEPRDCHPDAVPLDPFQLAGSIDGARAQLVNDLEPAAERSHRSLAALRERLEGLAPRAFRLAGSGSSCFGFFRDARTAAEVLGRLAADGEGRRYALRGSWILPARGQGMALLSSTLH
jgi:4-diphosphocytidyl-2-C-methyl-D-erythritol kinase